MVTVTKLPSVAPAGHDPKHHVGNPPASFVNPWPSFSTSAIGGLGKVFKTRFARDRPAFVPIPDRSELVQVRQPDFGANSLGFKATWIGHASFLLETSRAPGAERGVRILCDPVFSERTSPVSFLGPKRYTPTPCELEEVPDVDIVVISHSHYDHCDLHTIKSLLRRRGKDVHFFAGLGSASWFRRIGIPEIQVTELDWWDAVEVTVEGVASGVRLTCTPAQHSSGRTLWDRNKTLWCSWVIEEVGAIDDSASGKSSPSPLQRDQRRPGVAEERSHLSALKKMFFAGDTGYRSVPNSSMSKEEEDTLPCCPVFASVGDKFGPFDLALLPIGSCSPRQFLSPVHCNPSDSLRLHRDLRSKRSIGMHWGTVRGGISQEYEDVRWPPKEWRRVCEEAGLRWRKNGEEEEAADGNLRWEAGLMDIGETIALA